MPRLLHGERSSAVEPRKICWAAEPETIEMTERKIAVTEDELHAYVDGELPADRRGAVEHQGFSRRGSPGAATGEVKERDA